MAGNIDYSQEYKKIVDRVDTVITKITAGEFVEKSFIKEISEKIENLINYDKDALVYEILCTWVSNSEMAKASVAVAVFSAIIGYEFKLPQNSMYHLIISALLHDIGMVRVPKEILEKSGKLTPEEFDKIRMHTEHSYDIITSLLGFESEIGAIALEHHERWDGLGYPLEKKEKNILFEARIISLMDAYYAMMSDRPYRPSVEAYSAVKSLIGDNSRRYDPSILRVMIKCLGIYPVGSYVALNDTSIGKVVFVNEDNPLRPGVNIIVDKDGNEPKHETVIDISQEQSYFIVKIISKNEKRQ